MKELNHRNIPKIRFPGFTGEWEEKALGEIAERITEKVGTRQLEPISISAGNGIISQRQRFGKDISGAQYKNYIRIVKGDFSYNKGNSKQFPQGCIYELKTFDEAAAPNAFISFRFKETVVPQFFQGYFDSNRHGKQLVKYITSGARSDGLLNLNPEDFFKIKFWVPKDKAEQQKIASFLSSLDDAITAEENKLQSLKDHKRGLMQQLFPLSGHSTPQLRFPGFSGDWKEKTLGNVCDSIIVGFPFKGQDITDDILGHPILRAYSIGEGLIRHGQDYDKYYPNDIFPLEKYKVKTGDIVISMDGSVGRNIALVTDDEQDYLLIQRVARLRITEYPVQLVYQQIISKRFKDYASGEKVGAVIAHISQKQIESYPVLIPPTKDEQQKIASCLSNLDDLISSQQKRIDTLKLHKQGLMQQLFPSNL